MATKSSDRRPSRPSLENSETDHAKGLSEKRKAPSQPPETSDRATAAENKASSKSTAARKQGAKHKLDLARAFSRAIATAILGTLRPPSYSPSTVEDPSTSEGNRAVRQAEIDQFVEALEKVPLEKLVAGLPSIVEDLVSLRYEMRRDDVMTYERILAPIVNEDSYSSWSAGITREKPQ